MIYTLLDFLLNGLKSQWHNVNFWGIAITALGTFFTILFYWQQNYRALSFEVISSEPLPKSSPVKNQDIKVGDIQIINGGVLIVILRNSGNQRIKPEDCKSQVEWPIHLSGFDKSNARVILAYAETNDGEEIKVQITKDKNQWLNIEINKNKLDLEPGDYVIVRILVDCPEKYQIYNLRETIEVSQLKIAGLPKKLSPSSYTSWLKVVVELSILLMLCWPPSATQILIDTTNLNSLQLSGQRLYLSGTGWWGITCSYLLFFLPILILLDLSKKGFWGWYLVKMMIGKFKKQIQI
ncbi:hypothetical protein B9T07_20230 [Limnospira fusiformis CCALA 023]|uniref:hypothetical protein n=1 Tax=Oscillatoriales TaxID=1150 RepID=UPI00396D4E63